MKPSVEEIGNLLALKRHERPEDGYFDDFLREFHQRRRAEEAEGHRLSGWWRRASSWFSAKGASKWVYGGGLAYAAAAALFMLVPTGDPAGTLPATNVAHEIRVDEPVKIEQLEALDLRPSSQGSTADQEF